jgi:hypothetical protein
MVGLRGVTAAEKSFAVDSVLRSAFKMSGNNVKPMHLWLISMIVWVSRQVAETADDEVTGYH